jgi:CRP-like cAMP-binding protein
MSGGRNFLGALDAPDRAALLSALEVRLYPDGAEIVSQGDRGADMFVILDGRACVAIHAEDGRLVLLREMGPGDIFGEFAAIDGGARTADVVADGPVRAGRLSRDALIALTARAPGVALALMRHLVEIIRALSERVNEQTTLHVRDRLLRELIRIGRAASDADSVTLSPPPTHAALAANIGSHREAVTKQLSAFARAGLVAKAPGGLRLPSLRALEREAAKDATGT